VHENGGPEKVMLILFSTGCEQFELICNVRKHRGLGESDVRESMTTLREVSNLIKETIGKATPAEKETPS
jgi:hypothetical protein